MGEIHLQSQGFIGAMVCSTELSFHLYRSWAWYGNGSWKHTNHGLTWMHTNAMSHGSPTNKNDHSSSLVQELLGHVQHRFSPTTATTSSFSIKEPSPVGGHQRSGVNLERTIMDVMRSVEKSTPTCPSTKCSRGPMFVAKHDLPRFNHIQSMFSSKMRKDSHGKRKLFFSHAQFHNCTHSCRTLHRLIGKTIRTYPIGH